MQSTLLGSFGYLLLSESEVGVGYVTTGVTAESGFIDHIDDDCSLPQPLYRIRQHFVGVDGGLVYNGFLQALRDGGVHAAYAALARSASIRSPKPINTAY